MGEKTDRTVQFVIVIGTSAGGLGALKKLLGQLDTDIPAAILVVLHVSPDINENFVPDVLKDVTSLKVMPAADYESLKAGHVYIASPGTHLFIKPGQMLLRPGPEINRWKPSIDVLFLSAAIAYDGHCIGIILTGMLNDGTAGMQFIKRCGGTAIIQDPKEAEFPDMPLNVLDTTDVDYCLQLEEMMPAIRKIIKQEIKPNVIPEDILTEARIIEKMITGSTSSSSLGTPSIFACPDCGGNLTEIRNGELNRYRCHIGHSYTEYDLMIKQASKAQATLWIALRIMEERKSLLTRMARQNKQKGYQRTAGDLELKAKQLEEHLSRLKEILIETEKIEKLE